MPEALRRMPDPSSRWLTPVVIAVTLLVFAAALVSVNLRLRAQLRLQIITRDARVLHEVALLNPEIEPLFPSPGLPGEADDAEVQTILQTERLKEVVGRSGRILGARLFNARGALILSLPPVLIETDLPAADLHDLLQDQPVSHFLDHVPRSALFADPNGSPKILSVLEVLVPLRGSRAGGVIGIAQLLLDGESAAGEFAALDSHLWRQTAASFLAGAGLIGLGLGWAFRRLARANRLLAERTQSLLQANTELALAARTSAVGAVAAHLIHGLKNPLAGLQHFVSSRNQSPQASASPDWDEALSSTQRMQHLVQEVVRVLGEDSAGARYELTPPELVEVVTAKIAPRARAANVEVAATVTAGGALDNRTANLVMLILENLLSNALDATPAGRRVSLSASTDDGRLLFLVADEGGGIPEPQRAGLFKPQRSPKPGGSGIGLAISRQLANHLGAELELRASGPHGSVFSLTLPTGSPP